MAGYTVGIAGKTVNLLASASGGLTPSPATNLYSDSLIGKIPVSKTEVLRSWLSRCAILCPISITLVYLFRTQKVSVRFGYRAPNFRASNLMVKFWCEVPRIIVQFDSSPPLCSRDRMVRC